MIERHHRPCDMRQQMDDLDATVSCILRFAADKSKARLCVGAGQLNDRWVLTVSIRECRKNGRFGCHFAMGRDPR